MFLRRDSMLGDTDPKQSLIIEFLGIPGVGKTTVMMPLRELLNQHHHDVIYKDFYKWGAHKSNSRSVHVTPRLLVAHFLLVALAASVCPWDKKPFITALRLTRWLQRVGIDQKVGEFGICLMDEGLFNYVGNIVVRRTGGSEYLLDKTLDQFARRAQRLVVVFECDPETLKARWRHRTGLSQGDCVRIWGYRAHTEEEVDALLHHAQYYMHRAKQAIARHTPRDYILTIDAARPAQANAQAIAERIDHLFRNTP